MKRSVSAAIRCSSILTAVAALFVQPAQAYTVTLEQMGSNVVANGSGPINFTGLNPAGPVDAPAEVVASLGTIVTGAHPLADSDLYLGITGPRSFGSGGQFFPNTSSGDFVGLFGGGRPLFVFSCY